MPAYLHSRENWTMLALPIDNHLDLQKSPIFIVHTFSKAAI